MYMHNTSQQTQDTATRETTIRPNKPRIQLQERQRHVHAQYVPTNPGYSYKRDNGMYMHNTSQQTQGTATRETTACTCTIHPNKPRVQLQERQRHVHAQYVPTNPGYSYKRDNGMYMHNTSQQTQDTATRETTACTCTIRPNKPRIQSKRDNGMYMHNTSQQTQDTATRETTACTCTIRPNKPRIQLQERQRHVHAQYVPTNPGYSYKRDNGMYMHNTSQQTQDTATRETTACTCTIRPNKPRIQLQERQRHVHAQYVPTNPGYSYKRDNGMYMHNTSQQTQGTATRETTACTCTIRPNKPRIQLQERQRHVHAQYVPTNPGYSYKRQHLALGPVIFRDRGIRGIGKLKRNP